MILGLAAFTAKSESSFPRGIALILGGTLVWVSRAQLLPLPYWDILAPSLMGLVGVIVMWRAMRRVDAPLSTRQRDPQ
jgi:membrane protein implicated in regulation of membrane protease activity